MLNHDIIEHIARHIEQKQRGKLSVAVFASGGGSNLQALIDFSKTDASFFSVDCVVANNPQSFALTRAQQAAIRHHLVDHRAFKSRALFEQELTSILKNTNVELIVLAGFMRVLSPVFLRQYHQRIINLHPSLLPKHRGLNAIEKALIARDEIAGCTVHLVDDGLDTGPIIAQSSLTILQDENLETLTTRIQSLEHGLLPDVVNRIAKVVITRDFF